MTKTISTKGTVNLTKENKCNVFFDSNRDSITISRIESDGSFGNIIEANQAAIDFFGYDADELLQKKFTDFEDVTEDILQKRTADVLSRDTTDFETIIKNKQGRYRIVDIETKLVDYDNKPAVIYILKEISDRKLIEEKARKTEENLKTILDAIPDLLFEVGLDSKIYFFQSHREEILAYAPDEIVGKYFKDIMPPDVTNTCFDAMQEAEEKGWSLGKQYSLELPQGKCWFELSVSPIKAESYANKRFIVLARDITERKLAEEKLIANEKLLNQTQVIANLGSYFLDFKSSKWSCTSVLSEIFGIEPKIENAFEIWISLIHPDWAQVMSDYFAKEIIEKKNNFNKEYKIIKADTKEERWVHGMGEAIFDDDGNPLTMIGSIQDITERKLAEEELQKSEEKYRGLVENSPDGIITYVEGIISYVNAEAFRISGCENMNQIIGKSVLDFVHPDHIENVIQRMKDVVLNNSASEIVEEKLISLQGQTVYAELKAIPTVFENQNAVQVIIHDITERKSNLNKIKQLSQVVEQSPVSIEITDILGNIEYVNSKFLETTGYLYEEIIGKNIRFIKSDHTSKKKYKKLWQTISSGDEWFGEFLNKKKDGTLFWESASISPIHNTRGIITNYISIKEDITHRKIIEEQLIKAKEKAEESDRLKMAFLANMSHEIRTPMNGILGFTELLKNNDLSENEQQDYIKIIEKSGTRMLNIINDIINISKIESGILEVSISNTNLQEMFDYLLHFFRPEAEQKNIVLLLTKELPPQTAFITTDREKLYAILTNLIKNAIKFTNKGTIEFGCVKKGDFLKFFVKDEGVGISDSQQKIIFERFRQANDTKIRTHEGSGLGLAISKAYVENLGGEIGVQSKEGIGSKFFFTLPHCFDSVEDDNNTIKTKFPEGQENTINNLKVLIVEDDPISKLLIKIALKPYCKETLTVSTGYEAIEACQNNSDIDLVMMDINMPEMGGYEATKKIREFNKDLVIIAQTANGMQSDYDKAIEAGCTDYIPKPVNIGSLSILIQKYFKK